MVREERWEMVVRKRWFKRAKKKRWLGHREGGTDKNKSILPLLLHRAGINKEHKSSWGETAGPAGGKY